MPALTADRRTDRRDSKEFEYPMAANTTIYAGALVCTNASSLATPGAVSTTLKAVGVANERAVNGATAGAVRVKVSRGCFKFNNSTSTDAIALKDIGATCFIVDDNTVALTNGTNTRSAAGIIRDVDSTGVWVDI